MTLIVGIVCKEAVILASDSQTTYGALKRTDAEKLTAIKFAGTEALVAQAGNAGNGARALEIFQELAKGKEISDYRMPADLAREAMIKLKRELQHQYGGCSMAELQDLIWKHELQTELLLAYFYENKPYLFKLDLQVCRADKENSWYAALGSGSNLGSYLLACHTTPNMNYPLACIVAGYVVGEVCKHDAYCSPPIRFGVIINDVSRTADVNDNRLIHPTAFGASLVMISSGEDVSPVAKKIERILKTRMQKDYRRIERMLKRESAKGLNEIMAMLKNPTKKGVAKLKAKFAGIKHMASFQSGTIKPTRA